MKLRVLVTQRVPLTALQHRKDPTCRDWPSHHHYDDARLLRWNFRIYGRFWIVWATTDWHGPSGLLEPVLLAEPVLYVSADLPIFTPLSAATAVRWIATGEMT